MENKFIPSIQDMRLLKSIDPEIVKSMGINLEEVEEEFVKSLNREGLTQKEVQVQGKNGMYAKKVWVRAGSDPHGHGKEMADRIKNEGIKFPETSPEMKQVKERAQKERAEFLDKQKKKGSGDVESKGKTSSASGKSKALQALEKYGTTKVNTIKEFRELEEEAKKHGHKLTATKTNHSNTFNYYMVSSNKKGSESVSAKKKGNSGAR